MSVDNSRSPAFISASSVPSSVSFNPPDPRMPPAEFITLPLPPLQHFESSNGDISPFFLSQYPDLGPFDISTIPVPSCAAQIVQALPSQWTHGSRSITLSANGTTYHLPLWFPRVWASILPAVEAQPWWKAAHEWCQVRIHSIGLAIHPAFSHIPHAIGLLFSVIGWSTSIRTPGASIDSLQLTDFFSNKYLTGEVIDRLMEMFQVWAVQVPDARRDIFIDTLDFQNPFLSSFQGTLSWDAFDSDRPGQLTHLRKIADEIRSTEFTAVICPIHDHRLNHYVAAHLRIGFDSSQLSIGDSLNNRPHDAIDKNILSGFRHFSNKLGRALDPQLKTLPHSYQGDSYSCGIVTCNTIERVVFPNVRPWSSATKDLERAEFVLLLVAQLGSQYSLVRTLPSIAFPFFISYFHF